MREPPGASTICPDSPATAPAGFVLIHSLPRERLSGGHTDVVPSAEDVTGDVGDVGDAAWLDAQLAGMPDAAVEIPFAPLWWPTVVDLTATLANDFPELFGTAAPSAVRGLQTDLLGRLSTVSGPVLLGAFHQQLTMGQRLLLDLQDPPDDPPRTAFARFCARMATGGGWAELGAEFELFPGLVATAIRQWRQVVVELLTRVRRHRTELQRDFGVPASTPIAGVMLSAGDQHNDGRSVALLSFGGIDLVYKPRDMGLELLWSQLLAAVSQASAVSEASASDPALRAPRVLALAADDGSSYGFAEFIHPERATGADGAVEIDLAAFYRNAGRTLAVLYACAATDCHHENLVAAGDQLVLIDAEALFETRAFRLQRAELPVEQPAEQPVQSVSAVQHVSGQGLGTVLDVGLLPNWVWLEGEQQAIDISALGAGSDTLLGRSARGWRAVNTDAMSRGPLRVTPRAPTSQPESAADGRELLSRHAEDFLAGFRAGYRAVQARRDGLLRLIAAAGAGAGGVRRRLIQRPTYVYAALLGRSLEPSALRSRSTRARVIGQLSRAYAGSDPALRPLLAAEQEALDRLDVPLFETDLAGRRTTWWGGELLGWPGEDGLAAVRQRLNRMGEHDLAWQCRLIRTSIGPATAPRIPEAAAGVDHDAGAVVPELGERICARILDDAVPGADRLTWITLMPLKDGTHANLAPTGPSLYDGVLGVALYLHQVGRTQQAGLAWGPLADELTTDDRDRVRRHVLNVGVGWCGVGGYLRAYDWLQRARKIDDDVAARVGAAVIDVLSPAMLSQDRWLDVLNGVAGLIVPLADRLAQRVDLDERDRIASLIAAAADRLVEQQRADGSWTTLPGQPPLTGYAHGASGIAVGLATAALVLADQKYLDAALRGLEFEASTFDAEVGNWPDFRTTSATDFMLGWCAGAPGIALARMRLLQLLPDHPEAARWEEQLEAGARAAAAADLIDRDHLCCGNLGRAVILRALGTHRRRSEWVGAGDRLRDAVAARAGAGLPRPFLGDDHPETLVVPGLMTGQAGAGLALATGSANGAAGDWVQALLI